MNTLPNTKAWIICALLFFATTINYMDRQVFGILAPVLQKNLHWSEESYGFVVSAFSFAYAFGQIGFGRLIDLIGVRLGYSIAVIWWSIAALLQIFCVQPIVFALARFGLGLGQGGNFPAAIRTTAETFQPHKRSFATGIFNAGSNMGAIMAAIIVPILSIYFGWRSAFVVLGLLGFIWLVFWLRIYRKPHQSFEKSEVISIRALFRYRETWALLIGKALTDCVWWFYLYWLPKFFLFHDHIQLSRLAIPLILIYLLSDIGSITGGGLATWFVAKGQSLKKARKLALLCCGFLVIPVILTPFTHSIFIIILLIGLATAGHQGWSANIFTLASDLFPAKIVATVTGLAGFVSGIFAALFQNATGIYLQYSHDYYFPVFVYCGFAYVTTWFIIYYVLKPNIKRHHEALFNYS